DHAGGRPFHGPEGLPEVIDPRPHEITSNVVIDLDELPQLLHINLTILLEPAEPSWGFIPNQAAVIASDATERSTLGPNEAPPRERRSIDAVVFLDPVAPTIHIVVSDDIEQSE